MRQFHLHRSSVVVGLATLVVLALIVVPGVEEPTHPVIMPATLQHGWPWQFIERQIDWNDQELRNAPPADFYGVPWLSLTSWKLWKGDVTFHWLPLALDLLVAFAMAGAAVALWERRRRSRASAWQFRLAEVLFAMTAIAAALGWLTWQRAEFHRELALENAIAEVDAGPGFYLGNQYSGPLWLKRLVGNELLPDCLYRLDFAYSYEFEKESDCLAYEKNILPLLKPLRRLRTLELGGTMSDWSAVFRTLGELPQLRTLDLTFCSELHLSAADANRIAKLQQLTKLVLPSRDNVAEEAQHILEQCMPHCEIVYYYNHKE